MRRIDLGPIRVSATTHKCSSADIVQRLNGFDTREPMRNLDDGALAIALPLPVADRERLVRSRVLDVNTAVGSVDEVDLLQMILYLKTNMCEKSYVCHQLVLAHVVEAIGEEIRARRGADVAAMRLA